MSSTDAQVCAPHATSKHAQRRDDDDDDVSSSSREVHATNHESRRFVGGGDLWLGVVGGRRMDTRRAMRASCFLCINFTLNVRVACSSLHLNVSLFVYVARTSVPPTTTTTTTLFVQQQCSA